MSVSEDKISVYSVADLKNTSDDALPAYLNSLSFAQSHTLTDIRLALGYSAFFVCAATFYWDYTWGFDNTKQYTLIAVIIYTLLNSALTYWIWGVESGTVYAGKHKKTGEKIQIRSKTYKHVPNYHLTITTTSRDGKSTTKHLCKAFKGWFDVQGHFIAKPFQQMLAGSVDVIGRADPKNAKAANEGKPEKKPKVEDNRSMDDKWASLLAESSGTREQDSSAASTATPGKGGKKRGKKA
ncbi:Uncharacterized protein BP5553_02720 [Venustampulla echinocandica]|uniref:Signal peptidase complex subunit 2 n=1 Tax=Venustampulla echinocandica TaxID=2656787 RepID=A0A370TS83_9HELO|nr:Uncharacterized protein BP5553_02720 [Venustampulla echinocandica]RDL38380.1 Uncharacterized protein BP5553_02720 [Venustampulla echinocandica]